MVRKVAWVIAAFVVIAIASITALSFFGVIPLMAIGGTATADFEYPLAGDKIFEPVWGQINCEATGLPGSATTLKFYDCFGWGCDYKLMNFTCPDQAGCNLFEPVSTCPGSYTEKKFSFSPNVRQLAWVDSVEIRAWCEFPGSTALKTKATSASVKITNNAIKLKATDCVGYAKCGWIPGSEDCKFLGSESATLEDLQETDAPLDLEILRMDQTKNVIVAFRETAAFGRMNPLGGMKYNEQNILCYKHWSTGVGQLWSLKKYATVGGQNYWVKDQKVLEAQDVCCSPSDCGINMTCDKYRCTSKPTYCAEGGPVMDVDQCGDIGRCREESGQYFIEGWTTDAQNCCVSSERFQKCCPSTCDRLSTPTEKYICDPDKGCQLIEYLQECGTGACCNQTFSSEGKQWTDAAQSPFKTQFCASDKKCCYGLTDIYRGQCLAFCQEKVEICNNNKDDDEDGLVDCDDTDCAEYCKGGGKEECLGRIADGIWVVGWTWVETETPQYLLGFIPIQVGVTTTGSCQANNNWILLLAVIVIMVGMVFAVYYLRRKVKPK